MAVLTLVILFFLCLPFFVRSLMDSAVSNAADKERAKRKSEWESRVVDRDIESGFVPRPKESFRDWSTYSEYREKYVDPRKRDAFNEVWQEIQKKHPDVPTRENKFSSDEDYVRIAMAHCGKLRKVDCGYFGITGSLDGFGQYFVEWIDEQLREHGIYEPLYYRTYGTQWDGGVYAQSAWNRVPEIWRTDGAFVWEPCLYGTEEIIR